jgi:hypothetical protein
MLWNFFNCLALGGRLDPEKSREANADDTSLALDTLGAAARAAQGASGSMT